MPKKVMIVDDDTSFLEELVEMIKMSGYDVISSDNSADVVKIVRKEKPDVILMDLKMDGLNGFQLVMMLKHYKDISNIPVIIIPDLDRLQGCFLSFEVPELGVSEVFKKNKFVEFTPSKKGSYGFGCSMGMGRGIIKVI